MMDKKLLVGGFGNVFEFSLIFWNSPIWSNQVSINQIVSVALGASEYLNQKF